MGGRYARYLAVAGLGALFAFALLTSLSHRSQPPGLLSGTRVPPFAAPLALGGPAGDVNLATHADEGAAGRRAACGVRGAGILNICQLYERGPVVLALFIDSGSCPEVLGDLQKLSGAFPAVSFAAVAVGGQGAQVRRLIARERLSIPVALDRDKALGAVYRMVGCPQLTFAYPGGAVQGDAVVQRPPLTALRRRIEALLAGSRARGWRAPRPALKTAA